MAAETGRIVIPFDQDWRFHLGEVADGQKPAMDDAAWRKLDLPHDWMIEGPLIATRRPDARRRLSQRRGGLVSQNLFIARRGEGAAWLGLSSTGPTWTADVWLNGWHLGRHPYGYTSFHYDLTPHLNFFGRNVLAVRLSVQQPCSRWYSGAGIYRHVRLTLANSVHIALWGVCVTTPSVENENDGNYALVRVGTALVNQGNVPENVRVHTIILDPQGVEFANTEPGLSTIGQKRQIDLPVGHSDTMEHLFPFYRPAIKLWSIETPQLYAVVSRVYIGERMVDRGPHPLRNPRHQIHPRRLLPQRQAGPTQGRLRPSRQGLSRLGRPSPRHRAANGNPERHGLQRHPHQPQSARAGTPRPLRPHGFSRHGRGLRRVENTTKRRSATADSSTSGASPTR